MKRIQRFAAAVMVAAFISPAIAFAGGSADGAGQAKAAQPAAAASEAAGNQKKAKYVFLFIGDGMSMAQVNAAEVYANALASKTPAVQKLGFSQFPVVGLTTTFDASSIITDSASAGTAMASGHKTLSGVINMDSSRSTAYKTIAEYAKDAGMKVGVVSSVSIDHATPACFYAKVPTRSNMYDIAVQLGKSGFDYFGGGGLVQPKGKKGDQPDAFELAAAQGYDVVKTKAAFDALKPGAGKVWAIAETLQDSSAMPYDIDRSSGEQSLADFTRKGIELLSDDPDGFFMMVEGGKIDWACHANDAASSIGDTIAFDKAVSEAVAFAAQHPDETLIVVTGDHETGGMTIGFAGTKYDTFYDKIALQDKSFVAFNEQVLKPYKQATPKGAAKLADLAPAIKESFGIDVDALSPVQRQELEDAFQRSMGNEVVRAVQEDVYLLYGGYEPLTVNLTHLLNQNAGLGWTSYSHTGVPVATFAKGVDQDAFGGYYDNTEIFKKIAGAMGLSTSL